MTKFDIVKRLRAVASARDPGSPQLLSDAADEITALRSEVVGLRLNLETAIAGLKSK